MFTAPEDLTDDEVRDALASAWGLDIASVEHAPVGFGSHHWWVTTADGCRWFATADDQRSRRAAADEPLAGPLARLRAALTTAAALREQGLGWVVAARRTDDGQVVVADLRGLLDDPGPPWRDGPFAGETWRFVVDRGPALGALLDRYEGLVIGADPTRFVVTRGEPHRGNTLVTDAGVVPPPERDVWLVAGEEPGILGTYEQRTGSTLDARLLEAYRLRWDLADVASSAADLRAPHDDEDTRTAWSTLRGVLDAAPTSPTAW